jgi:hypothetical protein
MIRRFDTSMASIPHANEAYRPKLNFNSKLPSIKEQPKEELQESIQFYINNPPIQDRNVTKQFMCLSELTDHVKAKLSNIARLDMNYFDEDVCFYPRRSNFPGEEVFNNKIKLSKNCFNMSTALYNCFTNPDHPAYLGSQFRVCKVAISQYDVLTMFHDSFNPNIHYDDDDIETFCKRFGDYVYHTYLTVQAPNLSSFIIIDGTACHIATNRSLFIGTYSELLELAHNLMTIDKENYNRSTAIFGDKRSKNTKKLYNIIDNWQAFQKGSARDAALKAIEVAYQISMLDTVLK